MRRLALLVVLLALGACGDDGARERSSAEFDALLEKAKGQTVRWWMYSGDERVNAYVDDHVKPAAAKAGVTLERVPIDDTVDAVRRVVAQRRAGRRSGGAIDLIWINGENFASSKKAGLWLGGSWATKLPNARYLDHADPTIRRDFQVPVDGQEAPWQRAAFIFAHDAEKVPEPPRDFDALLAYAREHPGRFTYPTPPDFTGSAFVRLLVAAKGEEVAFAYLKELKPLQFRAGRVLPKSRAELDELYADGEVDFAMSYDTAFVAAAVAKKTFPASTRPLIIGKGALTNVSFVAIPADAANREGAQVVANLLLSPALQAIKANPRRLANPTVLAVDKLSEADRARFDSSTRSKYLPQDLGEPVQELAAEQVEPLEQRWKREVLR